MSRENASEEEAQTTDAFLGGLVTLVQPTRGHRAGLDAALLQALVPAMQTGHAVDLGTGVGTIPFCIAARAPALVVTGVERDASLVAMGRRALLLPENAEFAPRITLIEADAGDSSEIDRHIGSGRADWVLMNPPFDDLERAPPSPVAKRRQAHIAAPGLLDAWIATAARLLKPAGMIGLIHRPGELPRIVNALGARFGEIRILPVHASADDAAIRILVRARRDSRAPLSLLPGLVLHQKDGAWTASADAILRGRAELLL